MAGTHHAPKYPTLHVSPTFPPPLFYPAQIHISLSDPNLKPSAMPTTPLDSSLAAAVSDSDRGQHLLSLGRAAHPSDLAARCTAFPATALLVQRLCSAADSPISLSGDLYVTPCLPELTISSSAAAAGALRESLGKRKRVVLDCGFVTSAKRRLIVDFGHGNGERRLVIRVHPEIYFRTTVFLNRRISMLPTNVAVGLNKSMFSSTLFIEDSAGQSSCVVKNSETVNDPMETDITLQMDVNEIGTACADDLEPTVPTVSKDLVLFGIALLDENDSVSDKSRICTILEDDRVVGDSEEELLLNSVNPSGETKDMSQPHNAFADKLRGVEFGKLEHEDHEDTITLRKRLVRILENRAKLIVADLSVVEKQLLQPSEKVSSNLVYDRVNLLEKAKEIGSSSALTENVSRKVTNTTILEDVRIVEKDEEEPLADRESPGETEYLSQPYASFSEKMPEISSPKVFNNLVLYEDAGARKIDNQGNKLTGTDFRKLNEEDFEVTRHVSKSLMTRKEAQNTCPAKEFYVPQKQLLKSSATMKVVHKDKISSRLQTLYDCNLERYQAVATSKVSIQHSMNQKTTSMVQKSKQNRGDITDMHINERKRRYKSNSSKDQPEKKELPNFDSYIIEGEEGSGGYGTVYRARHKNDRKRVAIKCPHANAHKSHVNNELRMLERFGGKNFVIKYEGCIENGNTSCFVLQHVEHDRPEVLKKEINVCELRWYGYCLFRALGSLNKQGIVHRDVKPGNFLFSRKANKGFLIDFNLSMDLHQKYGSTDKSRRGFDVNSDEKLMSAKCLLPITLRKLPSGKSLITANGDSKGLNTTFGMKDLKRMAFSQMKANNDSVSRKVIHSQGADGSVITSVKDVTSSRKSSAERVREPLPCQGRKELINLVQETRESANNEGSSIPVIMRKRVPAPVNVDGKLIHVTPMPMHSASNSIGGPGLIRSRGPGKHKEGPCAGTKGFRAPEVLLRSPYQGSKIDVWSAGVTLLYMLIGRTPFLGEPELNINDIAKLRGSEDLWEVAKLHDRESSFPVELYNADCLPSVKLKDWCKKNTRRADFFEEIPRALFDLVDKCLTVNPRVRISAEEALKHEFFAPCHEELRKYKLQKIAGISE